MSPSLSLLSPLTLIIMPVVTNSENGGGAAAAAGDRQKGYKNTGRGDNEVRQAQSHMACHIRKVFGSRISKETLIFPGKEKMKTK